MYHGCLHRHFVPAGTLMRLITYLIRINICACAQADRGLSIAGRGLLQRKGVAKTSFFKLVEKQILKTKFKILNQQNGALSYNAHIYRFFFRK